MGNKNVCDIYLWIKYNHNARNEFQKQNCFSSFIFSFDFVIQICCNRVGKFPQTIQNNFINGHYVGFSVSILMFIVEWQFLKFILQ